jgi:hypothetical protein
VLEVTTVKGTNNFPESTEQSWLIQIKSNPENVSAGKIFEKLEFRIN